MLRSFRFKFEDLDGVENVRVIDAVTMEEAMKVLLKTEYVSAVVAWREVW